MMPLTDWVVIAVVVGILVACLLFDAWIRRQNK